MVRTHFLNFFRARWCASRPSERDLRALTSTWLRPPPPPYQRTQTVMVPGGPKDSTLPGHAGLPLAAPHTSSPTSSFLWLFSSDFVSVTKGFETRHGVFFRFLYSLFLLRATFSLSFSRSLSRCLSHLIHATSLCHWQWGWGNSFERGELVWDQTDNRKSGTGIVGSCALIEHSIRCYCF